MAIIVAILEFCWNSKRNAQQEKVNWSTKWFSLNPCYKSINYITSLKGSYKFLIEHSKYERINWTKFQWRFICRWLQQSLCSEMGEELRFALRCQGSRQRPTLRRSCVRCTPPSHTYVPTNHDVPTLHGVNSLNIFIIVESLVYDQ